MTEFAITVRIKRERTLKALEEALHCLNDMGKEPFVTPMAKDMIDAKDFSLDYRVTPLEEMESEGADYIVSIGGDGTLLHALQRSNLPVLGINCGDVGYLTELEPKNIKEALSMVNEGRIFIEERTRLKVEVNGKRLFDCTNEAVVHTSKISKIQKFSIKVDDKDLIDLRADGIIVATPTGSTCYAMSVGGPIVFPDVDAFIIVPIAPFKLSSRPIMVCGDAPIEISIIKEKRPGLLVLDGQWEEEIDVGDKVLLSKSENPARFVRFGKDNRNMFEKIQI